MEKMYGLIKAGLEAGFVPNVHAIGTRGVAEMLVRPDQSGTGGRICT